MKIVYQGNTFYPAVQERIRSEEIVHIMDSGQLFNYLSRLNLLDIPSIILLEVEEESDFETVGMIRLLPMLGTVPIILLGKDNPSFSWKRIAVTLKIQDYYTNPIPYDDLVKRIHFLIEFISRKQYLALSAKEDIKAYSPPISKRMFDIIVSFFALLFLCIPFIIIGIIIKFTSPGPIIYKSKRVGSGYQIFDFYKFRSMRQDADKSLNDLKSLNQYANKESENGTAFIKIKNDPRVTKIGGFLRNTSVDELPQLFNVLKGDMSLVGNRPLPLYEAEQLTSDQWAERFLGPAGLTGLWQVTKRGKGDMSEEERKQLDNYYARNFSLWLDIKIILKTIPALFQKEDV